MPVVCQLLSVNIRITEPTQLYLSNGAPAGDPLAPGDYVATVNTGQQPGWYSLYPANKLSGQSIANVYLALGPNGHVYIAA